MAKAYITVEGVAGKRLRTYGGNKPDVKYMHNVYKKMSKEEFLKKHTKATEEDFEALRVDIFVKNH